MDQDGQSEAPSQRAATAANADAFYRNILDSLSEGVYFVDTDRRITYWNRGAELISGYAAADVIGRYCRDNLLVHTTAEGVCLCVKGCPLQDTMRDCVVRQAEIFLKHRDGHRVPVVVQSSVMLDGGGRVIGAVEIFRENSTKLALLEKVAGMEQLAFTDPLTAVGNRRYTDKILREQYELFRRTDEGFAVLFLDLDRFKTLNDSFGHDAGDAVLKAVACTIKNSLRSYDFLGRWGGDEFVAVLPQATAETTIAVAKRCCSLVRTCSVESDGHSICPTISVGAAVIQPDESSAQVIARADAQLYRAKQEGRDRFCGP